MWSKKESKLKASMQQFYIERARLTTLSESLQSDEGRISPLIGDTIKKMLYELDHAFKHPSPNAEIYTAKAEVLRRLYEGVANKIPEQATERDQSFIASVEYLNKLGETHWSNQSRWDRAYVFVLAGLSVMSLTAAILVSGSPLFPLALIFSINALWLAGNAIMEYKNVVKIDNDFAVSKENIHSTAKTLCDSFKNRMPAPPVSNDLNKVELSKKLST